VQDFRGRDPSTVPLLRDENLLAANASAGVSTESIEYTAR
jgi:hypothetical protein